MGMYQLNCILHAKSSKAQNMGFGDPSVPNFYSTCTSMKAKVTPYWQKSPSLYYILSSSFCKYSNILKQSTFLLLYKHHQFDDLKKSPNHGISFYVRKRIINKRQTFTLVAMIFKAWVVSKIKYLYYPYNKLFIA